MRIDCMHKVKKAFTRFLVFLSKYCFVCIKDEIFFRKSIY